MTWRESFRAVVMDRGVPDWQVQFRSTLHQWGVAWVEDRLMIGDRWVGLARFAELVDGDARVVAARFLNQPVGTFVWTHAILGLGDEDETAVLVRAIAHAALGTVSRADTGEARELVVQRRFGAANLTSETGFDEGAALLEIRPGAYTEYVAGEIKEALAAHGLEAWVGLDDSSRPNPMRLHSPLYRAGIAVSDADLDASLDAVEVTLWALRAKLYSTLDEFWYDLDS
ncbi:MAG: hypothetical protein ABI867_43245 [Kofleriaceae bacterium]